MSARAVQSGGEVVLRVVVARTVEVGGTGETREVGPGTRSAVGGERPKTECLGARGPLRIGRNVWSPRRLLGPPLRSADRHWLARTSRRGHQAGVHPRCPKAPGVTAARSSGPPLRHVGSPNGRDHFRRFFLLYPGAATAAQEPSKAGL